MNFKKIKDKRPKIKEKRLKLKTDKGFKL